MCTFDTLKERLISKPLLRYPTFDRPFRIYSDASEVAIGGVLTQNDDEGREHPVMYMSRLL